MDEILRLLEEAKQLARDGKLDEAKAKREQAEALRVTYEAEHAVKTLQASTAQQPTTTDPPADPTPPSNPQRLPGLGAPGGPETAAKTTSTTDTDDTPNLSDIAVKTWYVNQFGTDINRDFEQISLELYGTRDYRRLTAMKYADYERYLRYGIADPKMERLLLLSPDQIMKALIFGVPVEGNETSIKATMVEAQDTLGGYLVPEPEAREMISRLPGLTVVRGMARASTTNRDKYPLLKRTGGDSRYIGNVRVFSVDESPTASEAETNATFGKQDIPVHTTMGHTPVSMSLLEDSSSDLFAELRTEFSEAAAIREDEQFLTGTGLGEPEGILNGIGADGGPFDSDIVTLNSGAATTIKADNIRALPWQIKGQYRRRGPNVAWVMNSATGQTISEFKDGNGAYLWREMSATGGLAQAIPDTLNGFMFKETEAMPSIAANTFPIIFGDFQGYRIVDRIGMSVKRYEDATTARQDQVVFVMRRRYGGQVTQGWRFTVLKVATNS